MNFLLGQRLFNNIFCATCSVSKKQPKNKNKIKEEEKNSIE